VGFEETNLVGNVYYVNHIRWQGRCRELFLKEKAPDVLTEFSNGLCLITTHCSCEYLAELSAFDELIIRMKLDHLTQSRITMLFDYWRQDSGDEELVARGLQQIACMKREGKSLVPAPFPISLESALRSYC
jgi:enediyne core biosynthesis thioesterase